MHEVRLRGGALDGLALHYLREGSGPPVLLVHGLGGFAESWRHNLPALGQRATVVALDLPGFGRSSKPAGRLPLAFFADAIEHLRQALGFERLALVGHSLGGAVAAAYALAHPGRVERLALLAAVLPGFDFRPSWVYRLLAARGLGELLAGMIGPRVLRFALGRCFCRPDPEEVEFLVQTGSAARASAEGRAAFLGTLRGVREDFLDQAERYRHGLCGLPVPVLVIHGRQDRIVPLSHAATLAACLPRAEARWLEGCGHFPQIERREVVNPWLAEFLASRPVPR
jgi:pimeloyl-ACP methyl ester carboxylesterase